jgi:hypothetical protein
MPYRVIQWATGHVGRAAISGIVAHPELELVGAWVHSKTKAGRDVGELAGIGSLGVLASRDVDELLALDADCVLYSPLLANPDEVLRIVEAGKNVVTPLGWFYPYVSGGWEALEAACQRQRVTLHGTGIHPGGITERFPLMVSALCKNVRHVRAEEWSDIRSYSAANVVREVMLFGKSPETARKSPMLQILGHGFKQSIDMLAAALGVKLDPVKRTQHDVAVAVRPLETPIGRFEAGTVAAQRFTWEGTIHGGPFATVRTNWFLGEEGFDPPWLLGAERFEVEVRADPPAKLTFEGLHPPHGVFDLDPNPGILATAMHCVNAIPYVCDAAPGIRTYLDLPLVCGRAEMSLRR